MPKLFCPFTRSLIARAWVGALAGATAAFASGVNAGSGTGLATATVVDAVVSQPIIIRLQAPQPTVQTFPIRQAGGAPLASSSQGSAASTSFGIVLVEVNAAGLALFSVAGANATSSYTVQLPTSADSLLKQSPSAAGPDGSAASLIVPTQALASGVQLVVEISQALDKPSSGELSVLANYN